MNDKYEQKNNTGSLFKNLKKEQETHSDYNGTVKIDNKDYWINAWIKTSKEGKNYMSLSFKEKSAVVSNDTEVPF